MTDPRPIPIKVLYQGAPVPNGACVVLESDNFIAIELDMRSKYCELEASCGHGVFIGATQHSLHLHEGVDRDEYTRVEFDLPGGPTAKWEFFAGSCSRYTLRAVFIRANQ